MQPSQKSVLAGRQPSIKKKVTAFPEFISKYSTSMQIIQGIKMIFILCTFSVWLMFVDDVRKNKQKNRLLGFVRKYTPCVAISTTPLT